MELYMNNWILHIEGLGKIKNADIEVSPFNLYIGDNNSGKSYIMTVIYGLLNIRFYDVRYKIDTATKEYEKCCQFVESCCKLQDEDEIHLTREETEAFNIVLNQILKDNKQEFIRTFFNKNIDIEKISVSIPYKKSFVISVRNYGDDNFDEIFLFDKVFFCRDTETTFYSELAGAGMDSYGGKTDYQYIIFYIIESMLKCQFCNMNRSRITYLPASRTGFMLTYKTLIASSVEDKFNLGETKKNLLTKPCSDFLVRLSKVVAEDEHSLNFQAIIEFIEEHILSGRIYISGNPLAEVSYIPKGEKKGLPLYVTSGVVTEITPLLLMLQDNRMGTLMMEEPEMCLHPKLQWILTRVFIKLYHRNTPVFITTHSDIILSHINNMIHLYGKSNKEKLLNEFGYDEEDIINPVEVRVYQFTSEKGATVIQKLSCQSYGIEAPTFQITLREMLSQLEIIEGEE